MTNQPVGGVPALRSALEELQSAVRRLEREKKQLAEEVERLSVYRTMAYRDHLTGLHNRRYFDERIREECGRTRRGPSYGFGLILVDVNEFKQVNDTHGHATGDEVLVAVGRFLRGNIRDIDVCVRLGGDEFALLLPGTDAAGCETVRARLEARLATGEGLPLGVGLSLGATSSPPDPPVAEAVLTRADAAMYEDKRARRLAAGPTRDANAPEQRAAP